MSICSLRPHLSGIIFEGCHSKDAFLGYTEVHWELRASSRERHRPLVGKKVELEQLFDVTSCKRSWSGITLGKAWSTSAVLSSAPSRLRTGLPERMGTTNHCKLTAKEWGTLNSALTLQMTPRGAGVHSTPEPMSEKCHPIAAPMTHRQARPGCRRCTP